MHEMDDVHRWLPSEVLRDIGIADTAERRRLAVVEDLAMRLAGVLGGGVAGEMAAQRPARPPSSCHGPQVRGGGATLRDHHALAGADRPSWAAGPPPPYLPLPAPAAPWQVMASGPGNTMVLRPAAALQPRLAPANYPNPLLRGTVTGAPATRRSSGTGFFLPRTVAADPRHAAAVRAPTNVPARQCRAQRQRRGNEAAATMARRQQSSRKQWLPTRCKCSSSPVLRPPPARSSPCHRNGLNKAMDMTTMHQPVITYGNYMHKHCIII